MGEAPEYLSLENQVIIARDEIERKIALARRLTEFSIDNGRCALDNR